MPDALKLYLKDIKDIPLLTAEEEITLARRIKKGDSGARRKMIQSNLRLVISIAKRYSYLGMPISDLIEEGNMGLMRAVTKFNPGKGFRFSTNVAWWIKQYVLRSIANQGKTIRIPVYMVDLISRYRKITERLSQRLGRKPGANEVAKSMKVPIKKIHEIEGILVTPASLDAPLGEDGTSQFMDLVESTQAASAKDELTEFLKREQVEDLLSRLTDRERQVLSFRYGLKDGLVYTLGETAKHLGVTRERIRQIQRPIVVTVIGEGGSGGALGIGVGDKILVLENSYYSVISPEGCAAILWKNRAKAPDAAACLKLTAHDLPRLGIIDEIVPEPLGGAHRDHEAAAKNLKEILHRNLLQLMKLSPQEILAHRQAKFRAMGLFTEA